jgi:NADP-dependent 3-hydroxy acid dehydrogenase YdfG
MPSLNQKIVWITGASSGIGEALAIELARQGARLVLSARRETELQRVAGLTGLPATDVLVLPIDMADETMFLPAVDTVISYFGRIDYVFQNAGISQRSPAAKTEMAVYRQLMEVDFFGVVALTKAILPVMKRQENGHFVVTSSVAGKIGVKNRSGYCASKHALHGFFDALRAEEAQNGLRVTMVCPGYIKTLLPLSALSADGKPHNQMDEQQTNGMAADDCARRIVRTVIQNKREFYVGGSEVFGIYLGRFWPGKLFDLMANRKADGTT